jgi:hypothetical protein
MQCFSPQSVKKPGQHDSRVRVTVPCGQCVACLSTQRQHWSVRLQQHLKISFVAYFVTLTYEEAPSSGLSKVDVQNYFKRLRNNFCGKFKYYLCGEYGSQTFRPHYHAIILFESEPKPKFCADVSYVFLHCWHHGFVKVGSVTAKSISYTTKYMITKQLCPDGMTPPFHLVSKGLGKDYIEVMKTWHKAALYDRVYVPMPGGHKASMPRYFREKIYTDLQRQLMSSRYQTDRIISLPDTSCDESGDNVFLLKELGKSGITRRTYNQLNKRKL